MSDGQSEACAASGPWPDLMNEKRFWYKVELDRVVDGDTIDVWVDLGFEIRQKMRLRLYGIDAPEVRGVNAEVRVKGLASAAWLEQALKMLYPVYLNTVKDKPDSWGRYLAKLYAQDCGQVVDINKLMVTEGHATWKRS